MNNLIGRRFNLLVAIEKTIERTKSKEIIWRCICDCGKESLVNSHALISGHTTSCGCKQRESARKYCRKIGKKNIKHGHRVNYEKTREYNTWMAMVQRCSNPKHDSFKCYGGRGIKVCTEWLHSFENFLSYLKMNDMHPRPIGMTLDRFPDNNGNYEPGNVRWATSLQQNENREQLLRNKKGQWIPRNLV